LQIISSPKIVDVHDGCEVSPNSPNKYATAYLFVILDPSFYHQGCP